MDKYYLCAYKINGRVTIETKCLSVKKKQQLGNSIENTYFDTIEILDHTLGEALKSALISIGKQVRLKNGFKTNSFAISEEETKAIFKYIHDYETIDVDILKRILEPDTVCEQKIMTLKEIKDNYNNKTFINFKHQRTPDDDHIQDIYEYLTENYMNLTFVLPSVVIVKYGNAFEIIDGMHRCMAIIKIPDDHPCLKYKTTVSCYNKAMTDRDKISMFRSINKSKPIMEIYFDRNATKKIINKVILHLQSRFGQDILSKNKHNIYIEQKHIEALCTNDNINLLMQKGKISEITDNEICALIEENNDFLYESIKKINHRMFDMDYDYAEVAPNNWKKIHDLLNRIHNDQKLDLNVSKLENLFNQIRTEMQLRINGTKELKNIRKYNENPFLFVLLDFNKITLIDIILMN